MNFKHTRTTIRRLQQAHADYIEAKYTGLSQIPGNPQQIMMRTFGETRTFLKSPADWLTRPILIGDESFELLDEIVAYYLAHTDRFFVEINPANFSQSQHPFWEHMIAPHLVARGLQVDVMRCVWIYDEDRHSPASSIQVERFEALDRFYPLYIAASGEDIAQEMLEYQQAVGNWQNYIAYIDGVPAATATLLIINDIGYMVHGFTDEQYRRRGCHQALIQARVADARDAGCSTIFAVSDIDANSVSTLQSCGFVIAYNYMMFEYVKTESNLNTDSTG